MPLVLRHRHFEFLNPFLLKTRLSQEKALESMKLYPLPLRSVKEARKLRNVGERVAADLERCVAKYAPELQALKRSRRKARDSSPAPLKEKFASPKRQKRDKENDIDDEIEEREIEEQEAVEPVCDYQYDPSDRVILLVDKRELARKRGAKLRIELVASGVAFEEQTLTLGDFAWVVRSARNHGRDYMLRHAVERKTLSDLSASIKDGRYREQKHRLSNAGLSGVGYLIEGPLSVGRTPLNEKIAWKLLPENTLRAALESTSFGSSNFVVHQSSTLSASAKYLCAYTAQLQQLLSGSVSRLLFPFGVAKFNERNRKDIAPTVADIFARQLLAVAGVSAKKVNAVVAAYPTPAHLAEGYATCESEAERRKFLESLLMPDSTRRLGPVASNAIAKAFLFE